VSARRLIVTGDDFGAAPEVNAAIVRAHRDGILTSTSLMVTGAAAAAAFELARATPRLAVGLHLVLAQGRPASPPASIPALVAADGAFRRAPVGTGLRYAWTWLFRSGHAQLRREIEAQLEAFTATGLRLAHVDGHLNMHLHPMILPILIELAPRYGIRAMRLSREDLGPALRHDRAHAGRKLGETIVFRALAARAAPRLAAAGIATADRIYGMHQTGHVDERYLLGVLAELPSGVSEIYCHPSLGASAAMAPYQPGYDHAAELAALTSARVGAAVRAGGIELISYPALGAGRQTSTPSSRPLTSPSGPTP
jgi:hopanoid biosynthesis associated protein HpnK